MKTLLLTGASSGIGAATAAYFASKGYSLILTGNSHMNKLTSFQKGMRAHGVVCHIFHVDFNDPASVKAFFKGLDDLDLRFDLLINNAGIVKIGLLQDTSLEEWERIQRVNVTAMYRMCQYAIPRFLQWGSGKIINVSSVWGINGASCEVAYSASKGAVNSFTKALAKELAPSHIPVNAVAFGAIDTSMNQFLTPEERRELTAQIPVGRMATPDEAAEIIYHLSEFGDYVTGQILTADGGWI
ncbi:MAG: SDR family oxidoreductase [Lachnospiraceae bacterium]|nr:SDR family oxidoreductase [Lachnospiraceae bacterium]